MKVYLNLFELSSFTIYNSFTTMMKGVDPMKASTAIFLHEQEWLVENLVKIPVIEQCELLYDTENGFFARLTFSDSSSVNLDVTVLKRAFPSIIAKVSKEKRQREHDSEAVYPLIMAPYLSEESAKHCEKLNVGYMDMSGNCRLYIRSLYVREQGHPNKHVEKRITKTVFNPSSKVSSMVLREIMREVSFPWKLFHLSKKLQCSIGQVFKVKDYLCEQLWAEMSTSGLRILDVKSIMQAWSDTYSSKTAACEVLDCHTLLSTSDFEARLQQIALQGIDSYLTGLAGGARYTPVVRYNKVHLLVRKRDIKRFLQAAECKIVDSGANVQIRVVDSEDLLYDWRERNGFQVVSPVQIYLDCMEMKGRGEEMAKAVLTKEIESDQG